MWPSTQQTHVLLVETEELPRAFQNSQAREGSQVVPLDAFDPPSRPLQLMLEDVTWLSLSQL